FSQMGGLWVTLKRRVTTLQPGAISLLFGCQTPMAPGPPTGMKMGGRQPLFDNSGTCPFTLFNFQRSVKHYRRHLTMRTAASVLHLEFYSRGKDLNATSITT